MSMIVFDPNSGKGVRYNEYKLDVSHMDDDGQRELLSLLRSGRCRNGKPRRVEGVKRSKDGSLAFEMYTPSADDSGSLV